MRPTVFIIKTLILKIKGPLSGMQQPENLSRDAGFAEVLKIFPWLTGICQSNQDFLCASAVKKARQ